MLLRKPRKPGPVRNGDRYAEGEELPPLINYPTRQKIVRVSKWVIRRLGHLMPKGAWLETMNWPGVVLTAKCRHCARIFIVAGKPDVGTGRWKPAPQYTMDNEPGYVASYELESWTVSEKLLHTDDEFETSTAFSWKRERTQNRFLNDRVIDVGPRDWDYDSLENSLRSLLGVLDNTVDIKETDDTETIEKKIIQNKFEKIDKRFYCQKVKTWL